MVTKEVTINNTVFTLKKMDAIQQVAIASKILPLLHKAGIIYKDFNSKEQQDTNLIADSIITLIKESNVDDLQFIMTKFLEQTYIKNICVMNKGKIIQPELVELDTALLLVKEHFLLNFESYLKFVQ